VNLVATEQLGICFPPAEEFFSTAPAGQSLASEWPVCDSPAAYPTNAKAGAPIFEKI
jgi:hypothetical protein